MLEAKIASAPITAQTAGIQNSSLDRSHACNLELWMR
jgi:hypothetical protein